ncbi:SICAvar, type I (fragment), partial [Plasmodium knowlesi strain H]
MYICVYVSICLCACLLIGKPCAESSNGNECNYVQCIADKWSKNRSNLSIERIGGDLGNDLTRLLDQMRDPTNQTAVQHYCTQGTNGNTWSDSDAHDAANKTACKLVAAGLYHISKIHHNYDPDPKSGDKNPYDNQEFHQFASCLILKAVVQKMKEQSPICDIQPGIDAAFAKAKDIKTHYCNNGKPCFVCNLDDNYDGCIIKNGNTTAKVMDKLNGALTENKNKSNVDTTLGAITKTGGNNGPLCKRLQCLSSRVQALTTSTGSFKSSAVS